MKTYDWQLGSETQFIEESFTLNSHFIKKDHDIREDGTFYIISYNFVLAHDKSAFTAVSSYRFETVQLSMILKNSESGKIVATERDGVLDEAYANDGSLTQSDDFISYVEMVDLEPGLYEL